MPFRSTILAGVDAHPTAGPYVETFQGHNIHGTQDCLSCPSLGLWGYRMPAALRRAILRAKGVAVSGNINPYEPPTGIDTQTH